MSRSNDSRHTTGPSAAPQPNIKSKIEGRVRAFYLVFTLIAMLILMQILLTIWGPNGTPLRNLSNSRCYTTKPIAGSRGNIYDCHGEVLSTDIRDYNIFLDLAADPLTDSLFNASLPALADSLSDLLGRSRRYYIDSLSRWRTNAVVYRAERERAKAEGRTYKTPKHLRNARYKRLALHLNQLDYDRLGTFPLMQNTYGMITVPNSTRHKLYGSMAAYTIEHGLEQAYNDVLAGKDGTNRYVKLNPSGSRTIPIVDRQNRPAERGCDIITTIDINLQDVVEGALRKELKRNNDLSGTAVVVECATGEIRAMANLTHYSSGEMDDDFNHAIRWYGDPGSTFKGVSLMALVDDMGLELTRRVDCGPKPTKIINGKAITDTHIVGNKGKTTLKGIFAESSNIGFAQTVCELYGNDPQRWSDYVRAIGLNEVSDIQRLRGLPFRFKGPDQKRIWWGTSLPQTAYGYEVNMTPMHTLMFYNGVANGGVLVKPILVKQIVKDGEVVEEFHTEVVNAQMCSPAALEKMHEAMESVTNPKDKGTASSALSTLPFKVAGKTGTAQISQPDSLRHPSSSYMRKDGSRDYLATFVGYFPAEAPKYSCIVSIKTRVYVGKPKFYTGAGVAVPVFRDIAEYIYTHQSDWMPEAERKMWQSPEPKRDAVVPTRYELVDIEEVHYEAEAEVVGGEEAAEEVVRMPDVVGMGLRDALYTLECYGVEVSFSGRGRVVRQSPAAGAELFGRATLELE